MHLQIVFPVDRYAYTRTSDMNIPHIKAYLSKSMPAILAAMLAGCATMADHGQAGTGPDTPREGLILRASTGIQLQDWQYYFRDARLQQLIMAALSNNRDAEIAAPRLASVYAQYGMLPAEAAPGQNPAAAVNAPPPPAAATSAPAPSAAEPRGRSGSALPQHDTETALLPYEAEFWEQVRSLHTPARSAYLATEPAQRALRLSLVAAVAEGYFSLLEMDERIHIAGQNVAASEKYQELIGHRHEAGVSSDADLLLAQKSYLAAIAEMDRLNRIKAGLENLLAALIGATPAELQKLPAGQDFAGQTVNPELFVGLSSDALLRRPDVLAAEQRLLAAGADIDAARADFYPYIALTGVHGRTSKSLTGLLGPGDDDWNFMPASVALFDGRKPDSAESGKAAVAGYRKAIQQAFHDVAGLLAARQDVAGQLAVQQANTAAQVDALRLVELRYKIGVVSRIEVLDAQRQVYAAEQSEIEARSAWLNTVTRLYRALGGEGNDTTGGAAQPVAVNRRGD